MEKYVTLLTEKFEQTKAIEAQTITMLLNKAIKIYNFQTSKDPLYQPSTQPFQRAHDDFRVIRRMHQKYVDVLEYFRESQMHKECGETIKEYQKFD